MATALSSAPNYYLVEHQMQLRAVVNRFRQRGTRIYVDTETTGLNPRTDKLVMLQLMQEGFAPVIVDWRIHTVQMFGADYLNELADLTWVGHNLSGFDWAVLAANGIRLRRVFDTQIAEQLIRSSGLNGDGLSLAAVVAKYAGVTLDKTNREWFYKPPLDTRPDEWAAPFPTEELEYGANDVLYLPKVFHSQIQALQQANLMRVMELEMQALPAISELRLTGIHIDVDGWRNFINQKAEEAKQYEAELMASELGIASLRTRVAKYDDAEANYHQWELERDEEERSLRDIHTRFVAGEDVVWCPSELVPDEGEGWGKYKTRRMKQWREEHPNPGKPKADTREVNFSSAQQLVDTLTFLGIPVPTKKDDKGEVKQTVGAAEIEKLAGAYPVLKPLLRLRKAEKFVDAFGEKLLSRVEDDGRIHPEYNQIGAETGRMSCQSPNWQQIPSRGDGKQLRACVTATEGYKLLTADLPNIELRILAELSGDENMLAMFASGEDLHSYTAMKMFGIPEGEDPKEYEWKPGLKAREIAKTTNFGVAYGQSYMGLATKFNLPEDEAKRIIAMWDRLYAGARRYLTEQGDLALSYGFSMTTAGRKRFYTLPEKPNMDGRNKWSEAAKDYRKAEGSVRRQAMNYPMQGLCVDIVKRALADLHDTLPAYNARIVAVVHDEIVIEAPADVTDNVKAVLGSCMLSACLKYLKQVSIPEIEVHVGDRWEH